MKIENNIARELTALHIEQNKTAVKYLKKGKSNSTINARDAYVKSSLQEFLNYGKEALSETNAITFKGLLSREFLDRLNGDGEGTIIVIGNSEGIFEYDGVYFSQENIPEISEREFEEIKATDNVVDFGKSNYFKYVSSDGKEHRLYSSKKGCIDAPTTDYLFGQTRDEALQRYARFWNWCMSDVTFINSESGFTREEEHKYLEEMGVDYGFVTIRMGEKENTLYHTKSKWHGELINKHKYDEKYEYMRTSRFGKEFGEGAVIIIGGKEYTFDANCQIDIPYGADIYDVKYPPTLEKRAEG